MAKRWLPGHRWRVADEAPDRSGSTCRLVSKDMSISHADFFRTVRPLLVAEDHDLRGDGVTIRRGSARIDIRIGPEGTRRLGNFHLPRTRVEIGFYGCPQEEADRFLDRFDRHFRRGGG